MALDKKAATYSGHGTYGSPEELDAYGVWVKSEPQDLASGLADAVGMDFGAGAMPYEADYDTGYDDMGVAGADIADIDSEAPHLGLGMGDFTIASYDEEMPNNEDQGIHDGVSTQILAKIADELTTIRSDLSTIKNEFVEIRMEGSRGEVEQDDGGGLVFAGDDEKISLTGDEMDTILTASDFSGEEEFSFETQRDADAARLRKLSERNEATAVCAAEDTPDDGAGEEDIIDIDLENLGIDLDAEIEKIQLEAQEEEPQDEAPQLAEEFGSFDPLDEIDEMRNLRLEGAEPLTPVPDDTNYLEEYPFVEESAPDLSFEESPFSLSLEEFPLETSVELNDDFVAESQFEPMDLSNVTVGEPDFGGPELAEPQFAEPGFGEPELAEPGFAEPELAVSELDVPPLEDTILDDMDDITIETKEFETNIDLGIQDDSLAQIIPEGFELEQQVEAAAPFDDDLEVIVGEDISLVDGNVDVSAPAESPLAGAAADITPELRSDLRDVLSYMDHLLESLPEDKIEEFAKSEYFDTYQKIFKELKLT